VRITVVGAGVIGITTALVLEREGHDVTVVAREKGLATAPLQRRPAASRDRLGAGDT
jgi:glycine/D-amino acid oxidase-like deaminating enzyme